MGNLPANEMTQFISAPTNSMSKVAPESEHNGALLQSPQNQVRRAVVSDKIRGNIMKKKEDIKQIVLELAQAAFDKRAEILKFLI